MRLTEKTKHKGCYETRQMFFKLRDKLGQLEDIEEELGIDLITLFKALKNGIYYGYDKDDIFHYEELELKYWKYWYLYVGGIGQVCFDEYGKTWALTKEELEK